MWLEDGREGKGKKEKEGRESRGIRERGRNIHVIPISSVSFSLNIAYIRIQLNTFLLSSSKLVLQ